MERETSLVQESKKNVRRQGLIKLAVCFGIKVGVVALVILVGFLIPPFREAFHLLGFFFKPLGLILNLGIAWGLIELIGGRRISEMVSRLGW